MLPDLLARAMLLMQAHRIAAQSPGNPKNPTTDMRPISGENAGNPKDITHRFVVRRTSGTGVNNYSSVLEKLTLHVIELSKQNARLQAEVTALAAGMNQAAAAPVAGK